MTAENSTPHKWKDYYKPKNGVSPKDHSEKGYMTTSFFIFFFLASTSGSCPRINRTRLRIDLGKGGPFWLP